MSEESTTECLLFPELFGNPAVVQFDQRQSSSDGGAILLKAAERGYGLIGGFAGCLEDKRQVGKVEHSLCALLAQRVFSIACGYPCSGGRTSAMNLQRARSITLTGSPVALAISLQRSLADVYRCVIGHSQATSCC